MNRQLSFPKKGTGSNVVPLVTQRQDTWPYLPPMKKLFKNVVRPLFFLGVGVFLIWLITKDFTALQWRNIRHAFYEANYWLLFPVFFVGIVSHYLRALRWRLLLKPLGYFPGKGNMFAGVMIGYLANLAIPRMGEVVRCGVVARQERIPVNSVIGTMVVERLIDLSCLLILMFFTIAVQPARVWSFFYDNIWMNLTAVFSSGHLVRNLFIATGFCFFLAFIFFVFRHTAWYKRFNTLLTGIKEGILLAFRLKQKRLFLFFTFFIWLCYFLMIYIGFYCFTATSTLGIKAGLSVLSFGSVGMSLTQGGLGAYQLLVEKTLGLYGINEVYGFAFGWLSWLAQTALILVLGFGCLLALPFLKKKETATQIPSH